MKVSVFGLGYVGTVSAACLAMEGHDVVGVDVNPAKLAMIGEGRTPVVEERIGDIVRDVVAGGRLTVTDDVTAAIHGTDLSLVCVGTPSASNGSLDTTYLQRAAREIGAALATRPAPERHTVVFRSTMLPGTCLGVLVPLLEEASGLVAGADFGVAVNPEFLREGSSVKDFYDPPKTVVGQVDRASGDAVLSLYAGLDAPEFRVEPPVAEMTKYVDNTFHGLKIGFANEIGALARELGVDSHDVMEIFLADRKLNISPAYLRPGFAFGGSCLPKDLRGLVHAARRHDVRVPILENVLPSNDEHIQRAFEHVAATGKRRVGVFGLAFKGGTDDLRESPLVELCERMLGKGYDLRIYDPAVVESALLGANRAFIEAHLPHLRDLLVDTVAEVVDHAEVLVVGKADEDVQHALTDTTTPVIDLVRLPDASARRQQEGYVGLAW
ncbi:MAG: GDP-mannose 6-dehydrogenase [uncultured Actinomycetospora sp.]|uniref:UDP-glucose 6-dehydrogenase n=1 Tax=uncultured Actinomycetospora sp. TaxID=1135996 RepID=A0A6J4J822_9PSEU|nr:MAG: GDP-mannose 6-dehydrogenase [uncultured Actinomycetospora sp.]